MLRLYRDPDRLATRLTTLRLLARTREDIAAVAARMRPLVEQALQRFGNAAVTVEDCASQIGSGALPVESLPSSCLAIRAAAPGGASGSKRGSGGYLARLEKAFRELPVPVIGRIADGAFRLDL